MKRKNIFILIIVLIVLPLATGLIGYLTDGFKNWNDKNNNNEFKAEIPLTISINEKDVFNESEVYVTNQRTDGSGEVDTILDERWFEYLSNYNVNIEVGSNYCLFVNQKYVCKVKCDYVFSGDTRAISVVFSNINEVSEIPLQEIAIYNNIDTEHYTSTKDDTCFIYIKPLNNEKYEEVFKEYSIEIKKE